MKKVDGLISVSGAYVSELKERHIKLKEMFRQPLLHLALLSRIIKSPTTMQASFKTLLQQGFINIVYVGQGRYALIWQTAVTPVFEALKKGMADQPELFNNLKFYFIGTSYAPAGTGAPTHNAQLLRNMVLNPWLLKLPTG